MPRCSNPIPCQLAKRELCNCDCQGANHSRLRKLMESGDPETRANAELQLGELKVEQAKLKKEKKKERRLKRRELVKQQVSVST